MTTNEDYPREYQAACQELQHECDGPLTAFVVIARAIRLARAGRFQHPGDDPIANALFDSLKIASDEPVGS